MAIVFLFVFCSVPFKWYKGNWSDLSYLSKNTVVYILFADLVI